MSTTPRTQLLRLTPCHGEWLVGDHLPGQSPGYLFLHGLGSVRSGEKSTSLLEHAAATGRACTRFDFRGHGDSSGVLGQVPIRELIADTLRILEEVGPCRVVGTSLGGLVGAFASVLRPDCVQGLALIAPALGFLPHIDKRVDATGQMRTSEGRSFLLAPHVIADARTLDERSLPIQIKAPTLLVHGTADEVVPHRLSEAFFAAMTVAHKQLWIVAGGDHRLNTQGPEIWRRFDLLLGAAG